MSEARSEHTSLDALVENMKNTGNMRVMMTNLSSGGIVESTQEQLQYHTHPTTL